MLNGSPSILCEVCYRPIKKQGAPSHYKAHQQLERDMAALITDCLLYINDSQYRFDYRKMIEFQKRIRGFLRKRKELWHHDGTGILSITGISDARDNRPENEGKVLGRTPENLNALGNLQYLCSSCHRTVHLGAENNDHRLKCSYCDHEWTTHILAPKACPNCNARESRHPFIKI